MNSNNDDQKKYDVPMADHEYDGIQEFDNPAPFWWQLFFYLSIAFAAVYFFYYNFGDDLSSDKALEKEMHEIELAQFQNKPAGPDEKALLALVSDSKAIAAGKASFLSKCASCHANDGGGLIGPNLTDHYWIHGKGTVTDIYKVVSEGVLEKGMPAWGSVLPQGELQQVVAFVSSLKNTHPATPKAPQGDEVK